MRKRIVKPGRFQKGKDEIRDPSPFDFAQGQDDDFNRGTDDAFNLGLMTTQTTDYVPSSLDLNAKGHHSFR
jgi:hypothetical protein